jgi:hypothetical protein
MTKQEAIKHLMHLKYTAERSKEERGSTDMFCMFRMDGKIAAYDEARALLERLDES